MKVSAKVLYPELSYKVTGVLFDAHNSLGRFCREKQYADAREKALPLEKIEDKFTNRADFVINEQLLLELKAKPIITKEDYIQIHRYMDASKIKLGIIVNFRNQYLKPIRIIRSNS